MPREMFGDVVEPVNQGGNQAVVHGAAVDSDAHAWAGGDDRDSAAGDGHAADAAVGDGVCGGASAASATTAAAAAAVSGAAAPPPVEVNVNPAAAPVEAPREIKPEPPPRHDVGRWWYSDGPARGGEQPWRSRATAAARRAGARRWRHQGAEEDREERQSDLSADRASRARSGHRHHRGDDRERRHVKDVKVLRSVPMLDQAALDAVRQWSYTPTLLNGQPVDVIMTVTVNSR